MFNIKIFIDSLGVVHDSFLETPINTITNSFLKMGPSKYIVNPHPNSSTYNSWDCENDSSSRNIINTFQKIYTRFYKGYMYEHETDVYSWNLFSDQFILYSTKVEQMFLNYLLKNYFDKEE